MKSIKVRSVTVVHCLVLLMGINMLYTNALLANTEFIETEPNLDELSSATLYLKNTNGYLSAPVLDTSVKIDISGIVAKVELEQTFHNRSTDWVAGLYTFPLPDQAGVNKLEISIGERVILGEVLEKKLAEQEYEAAKQSGKVAGLVSQHRPNLFSTRFANVPPDEKITIKLGYIQTVPYTNDKYGLRIPLTLTPRYSNSQVQDPTDITPPQVRLDSNTESVGNSVSIKGTLHGSFTDNGVHSLSHMLSTRAGDSSIEFSVLGSNHLDRDFILEWVPVTSNMPTIQAWKETVKGEEYLLATVQPPAAKSDIPDVPRELILVIDTSGSMAGTSIEAAKSALLSALSGLSHLDKFNIIEFSSSFQALFTNPQAATSTNLDLGRRFTEKLNADGGTEMMPALQAALGFQQSGLLRQVVFITDGSVGYEDSVIKTVTKQLRGARLFTVGIGTAPNQWFMRKVAQAGRGTSQHIYSLSEAQAAMSELLYKLENPTLTDISLKFDDNSTEIAAEPIPDLYANEPVVIAAKLGSNASDFSITGTWDNALWEEHISLERTPYVNTGLSTIWAKSKIESLEDQQRLHQDPDFYKSLILKLSLDHQIVSRYASFLAVEKVVTRPADEVLSNKTVPNLMPHGNDMQPVSFPAGSTGSDMLFVLCLTLLMLSIYFWFFHNKKWTPNLK